MDRLSVKKQLNNARSHILSKPKESLILHEAFFVYKQTLYTRKSKSKVILRWTKIEPRPHETRVKPRSNYDLIRLNFSVTIGQIQA